MLVKTFGSAVTGINATIITIEVSISRGIKYFLVGLPDNAVKESQQRIMSAIKTCGYKFPGKQITINMAPADIRKEGAAYDLPLAIGILAASEQIPSNIIQDYLLMGELSLDGKLQPLKGALSIAVKAKESGIDKLILPVQNAGEAALVDGIEVFGATDLGQVISHFRGDERISPYKVDRQAIFNSSQEESEFDFIDVKGQENVKRALEIAAAGGHNAILIGPPGAGKTMLAKRMSSILPPLSLSEALETTKIHSVAGLLPAHKSLVAVRPFRSPHHSISDVALVGGGGHPQPGEISLAHNGILFLDELPEFKRSVLEVLRQPMEDRYVTISRARITTDFPASFMLISSMNPCPCGYFNHPEKECVCAPGIVQKYLNKISGPLLDRIDLHVEVTPVGFDEISSKREGVSSNTIRTRVLNARNIQIERFQQMDQIHSNAQMYGSILRENCRLDASGMAILKNAMDKLRLSARAYDRILKVSRTIADIEGSDKILTSHVAEAIQYRSLDREGWMA